jgi:hypothetical protein
MARPEGFEPPTSRFVVPFNAESQRTRWKTRARFLVNRARSSLPLPITLGSSGNIFGNSFGRTHMDNYCSRSRPGGYVIVTASRVPVAKFNRGSKALLVRSVTCFVRRNRKDRALNHFRKTIEMLRFLCGVMPEMPQCLRHRRR